MNKIFLTGNLTKDPELKSTQSGKNYVRVAIAVKRPFSKDKDAVDFLNLMAWEHNAKFLAKWFNKGSHAQSNGGNGQQNQVSTPDHLIQTFLSSEITP